MSDVENSQPQQEAAAHAAAAGLLPFLVLSLRAQAEMQLGLMHFGQEEEDRSPDLQMARHYHRPDGRCCWRRPRAISAWKSIGMLENSLTELRFRFVQVSDEVGEGRGAESLNAGARP